VKWWRRRLCPCRARLRQLARRPPAPATALRNGGRAVATAVSARAPFAVVVAVRRW